ncbi:MarR family transcriptional regulator [Nocardia panacis]|uniref:MarR family transcriptional regulator n=1 Tax=Nocardia panacis TaxID=2340916 RepID=A0A3A4KUA4_9NOCA|nr:MarR family transcriptional regulator [Nocardia panacis]RJO79986.1 MarR family transcriptional regulator [Nocardia panacis]
MDDDSTALVELARSVRRASQELDRAIATCTGEHSVGRWHVLSAVADGAGRSMTQLTEATLLAGASLTRLIDGMISDNLVHRRVDEADRRRVLVFPTRRGLLAYQVMNRTLAESGLDAFGADRSRMTRTLDAFVDRLHDTRGAAAIPAK